MKFQLLFVIILLAVATFNSVVLILKRENFASKYKFLYVSLFFYNFCLVVYYIWFEAGFISEVPQLLRTLSPLMYLCAPFFFFFIRNSLTGLSGFAKNDWIHFLPAVLHFFDLLPFYLESAQTKSVFASTIISDHSRFNFEAGGLIPIQFHYLFRIFLQTIYFVYSIYLVIVISPKLFVIKDWKNQLHNELMIVLICLGWLVLFQFIYAVFESLLYFEAIDLSVENYYLRRFSLVGLLGLNLFVNFKFLFASDKKGQKEVSLNNDIYKAINRVELIKSNEIVGNETRESEIPATISQEETELIKYKIIKELEEGQLFTEKGMTLNQFSKRINLSPKCVSQVINKEFNKNFNEFLNQHRIAFAISKIEEGYLDDYTLEALGEMSGFNSRTTFFNAFKKEIGCSPSEYWKKFQNSFT